MESLKSSQKAKVKQLAAVTSSKQKQCIKLLKEFSWSVESAADAYFNDEYSVASSSEEEEVEINIDAVNAWFDKYKEDSNPDLMGVDGLLSFCDDIGVDPEDVLLLVISYHMDAEQMMQYKREEFITGMKSIGVSSIDELKDSLNRLREELDSKASFKKIYMFSYQFARKPGTKSVDRDLGIGLWRILLEGKFSMLDTWCKFVEENHKHSITKDEWSLTFDFVYQIGDELDKYDENGAWPLLIDEFVEHCKLVAKNQNSEDKRASKRSSKKLS